MIVMPKVLSTGVPIDKQEKTYVRHIHLQSKNILPQ